MKIATIIIATVLGVSLAHAADHGDVLVKSFELEMKALHYQCSVNMDPNACYVLRKRLLWLEQIEKGEGVLPGNTRT